MSPLDWLAVFGTEAGQLLQQAQGKAGGGSIAGYKEAQARGRHVAPEQQPGLVNLLQQTSQLIILNGLTIKVMERNPTTMRIKLTDLRLWSALLRVAVGTNSLG